MASESIEDIWDAPLEPSSPRPAPTPIVIDGDNNEPGPSKRPQSQTLFLADSDDEAPPQPKQPTTSQADIDAMFEDVDDLDESLAFQPLLPSLDLDTLRRQASAKHAATAAASSRLLTPHAILPSSSPPRDGDDSGMTGKAQGGEKDGEGKDGERKERKKIARMDEARLLGPTGFPALIKATKDFVPKGKGNEAADLNRLLQVYQFWTHRMYPKTQFKDTVDRVEKLCHSKRMHVSLSVWRDEAKGLINGMKPEENDNDKEAIDLTSDAEANSSPKKQIRPKSKSSSPIAGVDAADMDIDTDSQPLRPPSSSSAAPETEEDDFDIDAFVREEEERLARMRADSSLAPASAAVLSPAAKAAAKATYKTVVADEDEEAMWDALNGLEDVTSAVSKPAPVQAHIEDEDEDMWDLVRDGPDPSDAPYVPPPALPIAEGGSVSNEVGVGVAEQEHQREEGANVSRRPTNDEDWDDMYL